MISAGYEDGIDANSLRSDALFKMALDLTPSDRELCSQSTISRLENLNDVRALMRMGRAMVDLYCKSFPTVPKRITLDIDDTFDAVHGGRRLRISTPTTTNTDFSRLSCSTARAVSSPRCFVPPNDRAARRSSLFSAGCCARSGLIGPTPRSCFAATATIAAPRFSTGVAPTASTTSSASRRPRRCVVMFADLEASTKARFEAVSRDGKLRRFKEFFDGAKSWSRVERIIARVEVSAEGPDTRFVVTNLTHRNARRLYEDVYCRRGRAENHIKSWKTHLAADRTSCTKATADRFRLFLHAGAYWLMWGLRVSMPKRSMWRVAQFDTLRLRLIKIAARVVEMKTMIRVHLPTSCPAQDILRFALERIPRLVT